MAKRFDELRAYQEAKLMFVVLDRIARGPGFRGRRDLGSQLVNAGNSCAANIAEGFSRRTKDDMASYFNIAVASASEVQAHLDLALATGACSASEFRSAFDHAEAVKALCKAFIRGIYASGPWRCERDAK